MIVPVNMLIREFLVFNCNKTTNKTAIISGIACGGSIKLISFRQYITSIPIMAGGRTLPKYFR